MADVALAVGWMCAVCRARVDITEPMVWRCPNATDLDRHHYLQLVHSSSPLVRNDSENPFVAFRRHLAWDSYAAAALGFTPAAREALIVDLDHRVAAVAGTGFRFTPFGRADALSDALGFKGDGGIWVKDETNNVAGSHKARHLFSILLHLIATETAGRAPWTSPADRPGLAIASCGNAALAAATLAAAVGWPIEVFVPTEANATVVGLLLGLEARVTECPRLADDSPGDPCVHRFREAVAAGSVPFGVQGTENAWCLDGGRTIGWEMACAGAASEPFDRVFAQVGGGAFGSCLAQGLSMAGSTPRFHPVQTVGCAPLERAWRRVVEFGGTASAAAHWADLMWPWENVVASAADGILDDETYDWIPLVNAMSASDGCPVVASEADVLRANESATRYMAIDASHTGTAGLAGLLAIRDDIAPTERIAVVFSGIRR